MALPGGNSDVVYLLFVVAPTGCGFSVKWSSFCDVVLFVFSNLAINLMKKRELVTLFNCVAAVCVLCLSLPNGAIHGMQSVIVAFPGHTHLIFEGLQYDQ